MAEKFEKKEITKKSKDFERWCVYRTTDWANYLEYPEFTLKQTQQVLAIDRNLKGY